MRATFVVREDDILLENCWSLETKDAGLYVALEASGFIPDQETEDAQAVVEAGDVRPAGSAAPEADEAEGKDRRRIRAYWLARERKLNLRLSSVEMIAFTTLVGLSHCIVGIDTHTTTPTADSTAYPTTEAKGLPEHIMRLELSTIDSVVLEIHCPKASAGGHTIDSERARTDAADPQMVTAGNPRKRHGRRLSDELEMAARRAVIDLAAIAQAVLHGTSANNPHETDRVNDVSKQADLTKLLYLADDVLTLINLQLSSTTSVMIENVSRARVLLRAFNALVAPSPFIARSATRFGCSDALYPADPTRSHSAFLVWMSEGARRTSRPSKDKCNWEGEPKESELKEEDGVNWEDELKWEDVFGSVRLAANVHKSALFCRLCPSTSAEDSVRKKPFDFFSATRVSTRVQQPLPLRSTTKTPQSPMH